MFILNEILEGHFNHPKYLVILNMNTKCLLLNFNILFYYLISKNMRFNNFLDKSDFPKYLVTDYLYFNLYNGHVKFNISKLGTDYIFNIVCTHFKKECIGAYPDNYIFVNEPAWPDGKIDIIDKSSLKIEVN